MPRVTTTPKSKAYHHGDLRHSLIEAGLAIVEQEGIEALSLRGVARRAQVSHSAPYHHFADRAGLLAAVAAEGFLRMVAEIQRQATTRPITCALDGLRCVGYGYVEFAAQNPGVFRLMFRPELTRPAQHPPLQQAEALAFGKLLESIIGCQAAGELPTGDPFPLALFAWSGVHGLAVLHVEQVLGETPLGERPFGELAHIVNETIIAGLKTQR